MVAGLMPNAARLLSRTVGWLAGRLRGMGSTPRPLRRQQAALADLVARAEAHPSVLGAILIGSLVAGGRDALSDVDCIVVTDPDAFQVVWADRCSLHDSAVTVCWDYDDPHGPPDTGAHKWLDSQLVLVECLITAAGSDVRLAPPNRVVVGPADLVSHLDARPPVDRAEMREADTSLLHDLDVETAYDLLKDAVRRTRPAG
jgi:hypothetical protein